MLQPSPVVVPPGSSHAPHSASLAQPSGARGEPRRAAPTGPRRRPMSTDVLSDVLRAVRLTGATYFSVKASEPWAAEAFPAAEIASRVMPSAEHLFEYHLMTQGSCWVGIVGEEP